MLEANPTIEPNESFTAIGDGDNNRETTPSPEENFRDFSTTSSEELSELRERVKLLEEELKRSEEILTAEKENKEHVRKTYENVLEDFKQSQNKQLEIAKELARFKGETELKRLKQKYEKKLKEKPMTIYKIADSSIEEESFFCTECQLPEEDIEEVLQDIKNAENQRSEWNKLIEQKDSDIIRLSEKRKGLEKEIEGVQARITTASIFEDSEPPNI